MSVAVTAEQVQFAEAVKRWGLERGVRGLTRRLLDEPDAVGHVDDLWRQLASFGWAGLLVPDDLGGSGGSWVDGAVLAESLGFACAPLPVVPTLAVSAALAESKLAEAQLLLKGVVAGSVRLGVLLAGDVAIGGGSATHLAVVSGADLDLYDATGFSTVTRALLDVSSGSCEVTLTGAPLLRVPGAASRLRTALRVFGAADSVGVAQACLTMAVEYAKSREAFGRTIGSFQAVKHHCSNMLLTSQLAAAATWRAAAAQGGPDEAALGEGAAFLAAEAGRTCATTTLQVLGGIGFTWEHDLHLYLRRAGVTASQLGPREELATSAGRSELAGSRPRSSITLPPEAQAVRAEVEAFRERVLAAPRDEQHAMVVDQGYLHPGWPAPWGRSATPLEQIVVEQVLQDVDRVSALGPTYWEVPIVLPTILDCATPEQIERWMRPSMMGEIHWCQLFSEPSAGSDLAALRTRAVRADGGWLVTGQKVWTSDAHHADFGMALVRTNPEVKKHRGITCVMVDMRAPGVEVRPLRQITGEAHFNEVFLDNVFVPDADVLGPVDGGWRVALNTLGHERLSLGAATSIWTSGQHWELILEQARRVAAERPDLVRRLGDVVLASEGALSLSLRSTYRALLGQPVGIDGTIGKTVVADLAQKVGDLALDLMGPQAAFADGGQEACALLFLQVRMATIAGGTSEVLRNLLAEQALGLPREPVLS